MTDSVSKPLLPEGLRDLLPPDAAFESDAINRIKQTFAANGYDLVKPPLAEFEETLLSGVGTAMGARIFRMPDPVSHRALGIRADITTQVARIASTRLSRAPRPLRLMYSGQVLRVRGTHLEPERQFSQAGLELIGSSEVAADAEVIVIVSEALEALGVKGVSIDLALPTLVPSIVSTSGVSGTEMDQLRSALDHKDVGEIKRLGGSAGDILSELVRASGPLDEAISRIRQIQLPEKAAHEWKGLVSIAQAVSVAAPNLALTVDAVENRGFEYHTGVTFSVFAQGSQRELGRGGRYNLLHNSGEEPATGATLFVDALLGVVPENCETQRLLVPLSTSRSNISKYQNEGWSVVVSLGNVNDPIKEASRLNCSHVLMGSEIKEV